MDSGITIVEPTFHMAQSAAPSEGKNPLGITGFWPSKCIEPIMMWEFWYTCFQLGMVAKHGVNHKTFHSGGSLTTAQITALPEEVDGKNRLKCEQMLISNLYLCLEEKGQEEFHNIPPHMDLGATRYPRVFDALEAELKKERIATYEIFQLPSRKQQISDSLEHFTQCLAGWHRGAVLTHWKTGYYETFSLSV